MESKESKNIDEHIRSAGLFWRFVCSGRCSSCTGTHPILSRKTADNESKFSAHFILSGRRLTGMLISRISGGAAGVPKGRSFT